MWFSANLLFESTTQHDDLRVLQEESIRLIEADDEAQARSKAIQLGISEQHSYPNDQGEIVAWEFVTVLDVQDLCEETLVDGVEVFSTLKWRSRSPAEQR